MNNGVVVSGISGRFPESNNVDEFWKNLINGTDMVTEDDRRWKPGLWGLPKRNGKLKQAEKFDATFFGVHSRQANNMDPQLRMLLETSYEAIYDAGINPQDIRGTNTGVWVGASGGEAKESFSKDPETLEGYSMTGCATSMFANRISFCFDFKGPSFVVDTACSSSLLAFHLACDAILAGKCDAALVAGANLVLKPHSSLQFQRLNMLSADGKCRSFDANGSGYVRSETVASIYICRKSQAKQLYLEVLGSGTNTDGNKKEGVTFPSGAIQKRLLQETCTKTETNPHDVVYIEAHGTGTKAGDPQEVNTISDVFCTNRKQPLLIGSVKSNMGHSEPASGIAGIIKCALVARNRIIPPNLHFETPNANIPGLTDGRLSVVTQPSPLPNGLLAINSFGFGGSNVHALLKPCNSSDEEANFETPQLICFAGRTEEGIRETLKALENGKIDSSTVDLLNEISDIEQFENIAYYIHGDKSNLDVATSATGNRVGERRPIWYICSGMGTQWKGMGKDLMKLDVFASAIQRCTKALEYTKINVEELLLSADDKTFQSTTNTFVAMASIQVGLIDVLRSLNIQPDGLIGHSVGELACGYADGCLTLEQTVQAAHCRGSCIESANLTGGAMAAVGLSWDECRELCPSGVTPACHNSKDSVTISGEAEAVKEFVASLREKGTFAKEVNTSGVAFHSKAMQKIYPTFVSQLKEIIPSPLPRSKKWISTSVLEEDMLESDQFCSAEYHANNLLSPVLFQEALRHVPSDAIVIEIAPHGLLQAILRRSLPKTCSLVPLTKRFTTSEIGFLLSAVGKLYINGCKLDLSSIQNRKKVFPVVNNKMSLSSMINWDHSQNWNLPTGESFITNSDNKSNVISASFMIDLAKDSKYQYMEGHCIDGRILLPATGYLYFVWKCLADHNMCEINEFAVQFTDVTFHRATVLHQEDHVALSVQVISSSNEFRVSENCELLVSGKIVQYDEQSLTTCPARPQENGKKVLQKSEVYRILRLRGYHYRNCFKAISKMDQQGQLCLIDWDENWVPFLDAMLQMQVIGDDEKGLKLPTRIQQMKISPKKFMNYCKELKVSCKSGDVLEIPVHFNKYLNTIVACDAVEISGLHATSAPQRHTQAFTVIEEQKFISMIPEKQVENINMFMDIILENLADAKNIKCVDTIETYANDTLENFDKHPLLNVNYISTCPDTKLHSVAYNFNSTKPVPAELNNCNVVIISNNKSEGEEFKQQIAKSAKMVEKQNGFVVIRTSLEMNIETLSKLLEDTNMCLISFVTCKQYVWVLCRKRVTFTLEDCITLEISDDNEFEWVDKLKGHLTTSSTKPIWLISNDPTSGILGLIRCLKLEPGGGRIRCLFNKSPGVDLTTLLPTAIERNLVIAVYQNNNWGTYRYQPMKTHTECVSNTAYIKSTVTGDLSTLHWYKQCGEIMKEPSSDNYKASYAALNFRDIMLASGKLSEDAIPADKSKYSTLLGMEFSGWDKNGNRVMGLVEAEGLATHVRAKTDFVWKVPDSWTLQEACSVPVVYSTAYYSLIIRGNLRPGESVLIHSGSGGVGQAAIAIALSMNCKVFTTVSTQAKRDYLKERFSKLTDASFANSRNTSFEKHVMEATKGQGVDVILNSLSGEMLFASVRCLAKHGRFLEIGKYDLSMNSSLGMAVFLKNISFHGILLDSLFDNNNEDWVRVNQLMTNGIETGVIRPLKVTAFDCTRVEDAFRFMSQGKHIGKVALKLLDDFQTDLKLNTLSNTSFPKNKSYLITGGLGGFGLELINWMILNGARSIVITSRSGVKTAYQQHYLEQWRSIGADITISNYNVANYEETEKLIDLCQQKLPLGGVFHLAMVLQDSLFSNQTVQSFKNVAEPKIKGVRNLDNVTRAKCKSLEHFVGFSSIVSGRGNAGQTNYGFANSGIERICEERKSRGYPAMVIQWGAIGDVGVLIDTLGDRAVGGTLPQPMKSCLKVMSEILLSNATIVTSFMPETKVASSQSQNGSNSKTLTDVVANIMGIKDVSNIKNLTLANLGLDSLMGVEIQQVMEREFAHHMSMNEVRELTFSKLIAMEENSGDKQDDENSDAKALLSRAHEFGIQTVEENETKNSPSSISRLKSDESFRENPWFLVHPIEGNSDILKDLADQLDGSCYGFNCVTKSHENIQELATHYISEMKKIQGTGPYRLAGYSFGACVAFEMALQLQDDVPKLFLLDSSHSYVSSRVEIYADIIGDADKEESAAFATFLKQINSSLSLYQIRTMFADMKSTEQKLELIFDTIKSWIPNIERQSVYDSATKFLHLLRLANTYKPSSKYCGNAVLIKSNESNLPKTLTEDYKLSEVCNKSVLIHKVASDHRNLVFSENAQKVAAIMRT